MRRRAFSRSAAALALCAPWVRGWVLPALLAGRAGLLLARVPGERRLVFVIQRGAADGLDTVVPHFDPDYARLRGAAAIDASQSLRLDGGFGLHPSMPLLAARHAQHEALFVHALATGYRGRSHFDAQNVLETGGAAPYRLGDGWLNRLLALLGGRAGVPAHALALAPTVPMVLRGTAPVQAYAPVHVGAASDDLLARVGRMYAGDPQLARLWEAGAMAAGAGGEASTRAAATEARALGAFAAARLGADDGARVAVIETSGWDTHSAQQSRLAQQLARLDDLLDALRTGLGEAWRTTSVLVATEFGRTAAINGTGGTDHGTASLAMLVGGDVAGGRVVADWPGLSASALTEGRDLRPTLGFEALVTGLVAEGFGLAPERVARALFPQAGPVPRTGGWLRS